MEIACLPEYEVERIEALRRYEILDTPAESVFDSIVELAAYLCRTPVAAISLVDEQRQWFKASTGLNMRETSRDVAFCAHAILQDEPLLVPDARQDVRFADNPLVTASPNIRFYAGVPLVTPDGYPLGTLCVIDYVPRELERQQLDALQTLAVQVMAQMELRLSRGRYQYAGLPQAAAMRKLSIALNQTDEAIALTDLDAHYTYVNPAFSRLFGYAPEELLGQHISLLMPDQAVSGASAEQAIDAALEHGEFHGEVMRQTRCGRVIPVLLKVVLFRDERMQAGGYVATMTDLSEIKRVEGELRASERQLQDMFEHAPLGMATLALDGSFLRVNRALCNIVGYAREELTGIRFSDITHPEDIDISRMNIARLLKGGIGAYLVEKRYIHKDGHPVWARVNTSLQRNAAGEPQHLICQMENISATKQAEALQQERKHFLRAIFESALDAVVLMNGKGQITGWNGQAEKIFGWRRDEVLGRSLHETIMPARYREAHRRGLEQFLSGGEGAVLNARIEIAALHRDGHEFPIELAVSPIKTAGGYEFSSFIRDISKRKATEEKLRLAALVYQHAGEAMLVSDANNDIIAINPAFSKMTGYSADEVIGKNPKILSSGQQGSTFYQEMWQELLAADHWQGEIWNRRKNGEIYAERLTVNVIRNQDGSVYRYLALFSDITEKKRFEEQILSQANFDNLTGLPNRRLFHDRLGQQVKQMDRSGHSMALLFIDLDRFKEVNDTLGHHVGDRMLMEAARRIDGCVRETDTVARLGGDEFTVILPNLTDPCRVERISEAIIRSLSEPFRLGNETIYISASVGITLYPEDAGDVHSLLKNADQAMYAAKNKGRNRYCYFTSSMQEAALVRHRLVSDLRDALAGEQLEVHFQPIVDLATGRITKAEALLRWRHPERGMVGPAEFIAAAEETGLIVSIGDWVFRQAAWQAKQWLDNFGYPIQVSVNMSPAQFLPGIDYRHWLDYMRELGLPGEHVVIEITEGLLLRADEGVARQLDMFREAGIGVAIDDFGTGYSAFSYLKKFEIDFLKIDRSFIGGLNSNSGDLALSEAIIVMAHKLGLQVIAEGVETEEQRALLTGAGCSIGQGYLFSRAVAPEAFEALLKASLAASGK